MSVIAAMEIRINNEVKKLHFQVEFIPGVTPDGDRYKASHKTLKISCYGLTIDGVLANAQREAKARALQKGSLERALSEGVTAELELVGNRIH